MSEKGDPWRLRHVADDVAIELWNGDAPALVLTQRANRVCVDLASIKALVSALVDAAADLAEAQAAGESEVFHE